MFFIFVHIFSSLFTKENQFRLKDPGISDLQVEFTKENQFRLKDASSDLQVARKNMDFFLRLHIS